MRVHQLKGSVLSLLFILLNLFYLVIELSFNARVLDISAAVAPDTDFGQLEVYGRTIAASGATILVWRLVLPYAQNINWSRLVVRLFLVGLVVFPTMFIGQKKLVDDLVDLSSAETRRSAEILSLLKYGIASGFVEIEELALDEVALQTAEGKMFITLSGLLAYHSASVRAVLESKLEKIADYAIATQQGTVAAGLYRNYSYAQKQVVAAFSSYQEVVEQLELEQAQTIYESRRLYEQAMNHAATRWTRYRNLLQTQPAIDEVDSSMVDALMAEISSSRQFLAGCVSTECVADGLARLEISLSQIVGQYTALGKWCNNVDISPTSRTGMLRCIDSPYDIKQLVVATRYQQLARLAGLERAHDNRLTYLKSADFRSSVFAFLREHGIRVGDNWAFSKYGQVVKDIQAQLEAGLLQGYHRVLEKKFAARIKPRTSLKDFNRLPAMQAMYHRALGDRVDLDRSALIPIGLNREAFEQRFIAPGFDRRFELLYTRLNSGVEWYADGAPYEELGKNSLRNLVIPAVAIAFSLVFGLLNTVSLLLSLVFLMIEESRILRWLGVALLIGTLAYLPMNQPYQIYHQQAYHDWYRATEDRYGRAAYLIDWLARAEPMLYPLASVLRTRVLNGFEFD
jgi:hypothetical protein